MANGKENLIPIKSTEEARERGRAGGKKSGEVRRKRKEFKEALLLALETKKGNKTIQDIGIDSLMVKYMTGDLEVFKTVRDTVGEKPKENLNLSGDINNPFSGLSTEELRNLLKDDE